MANILDFITILSSLMLKGLASGEWFWKQFYDKEDISMFRKQFKWNPAHLKGLEMREKIYFV